MSCRETFLPNLRLWAIFLIDNDGVKSAAIHLRPFGATAGQVEGGATALLPLKQPCLDRRGVCGDLLAGVAGEGFFN